MGITVTLEGGYTSPTPSGTPIPVPQCAPGERIMQTVDQILCIVRDHPGTGSDGSTVTWIFIGAMTAIATGLIAWSIRRSKQHWNVHHHMDEYEEEK